MTLLEHRKSVLVAACGCLLAVLTAGCGYETYNERLNRTTEYYGYLDRLDQNLAGPWRSPPVDELRVPKNFKEMPAPQPTQKPDGSLEMPAVDPRQPEFANLFIDGLLGAWQAEVDVGSNNERVKKPAYLYVASNGPLFLSKRVEEAIHFTKNFIASTETALQTTGKPERAVDFPKGHQFVTKQTFDLLLLNSDQPIHDTRYSFELYSTQQGDNQVVVLLAIPAGMDPESPSNVLKRIQLTLETMKVSNARPQAKPAGGAAGGQPAPSGGGF